MRDEYDNKSQDFGAMQVRGRRREGRGGEGRGGGGGFGASIVHVMNWALCRRQKRRGRGGG